MAADKYTRLFKLLIILQIAIHLAEARKMEFKVNKHGLKTVFMESELMYNWYQALTECTRRRMTLLAVDTAEKNNALTSILKENSGKWSSLWIGGHDLAREGQFVWASTGKPFSFTNWRQGMPDNHLQNENCVHIHSDFKWNDMTCDRKYGFLCEG